ncbi:Hsp20/alpha crystallin family protein [Nitratifractor sp.]
MKRFTKFAFPLIAGTMIAQAATPMTAPVQNTNDPFAEMEKVFLRQMQQMRALQQEMDKVFQNFTAGQPSGAFFTMPSLAHSTGILSSGFQDKGDHYELTVKVNDLKNSQINITTENGMLNIEVTEKKKVEKKLGNNGKMISYASSRSAQSFSLPADADPATIQASQKGDTIVITIAKKQQAKVIPIQKDSAATTAPKGSEKPVKVEEKK